MKKKIFLLTILSLLMFIPNIVKAETGNVVFLGDSLIDYYDIKGYLLKDNYINSGVAGNTTDDILNNMQDRVYKYEPSKVVILIGTNDIVKGKTNDYIIENIEEIINKIKEHNPNCNIYLESLYPVNKTNNSKINHSIVSTRTNTIITNINNQLKNIENATYVDVYSKLIDSSDNLKLAYTKEGLHLNSNGYDVVSNVLKNVLKKDSNIRVSYSSKTNDWSEEVSYGFTGTTGASTNLKAFNINLIENDNLTNDKIQFSVFKNNTWSNYVSGGNSLGEENNNNLDAIRIKLVGDLANNYDIYYRVHSSNIGWFDWAKNGQISGSVGNGYQIEAIEVIIVSKNEVFYGKTKTINNISSNVLKYSAHVQNIGWQNYVTKGNVAGTTGRSLRLEALKIDLQNYYGVDGSIEYTSYSKSAGWQDYVTNNNITGTTGKSTAMESIRIRLTDNLANDYDIYYRVHVSEIGWLGWAKNDEVSGTIGYGNRIEAIQIMIVDKSSSAPGSTANKNIIKSESILYQAHVQDIGWQNQVENGVTAGTVGQSKRVESLKISLGDYQFIGGGIEYSALVEGNGWQNYVSDGNIAGTTGKSLMMQAIKIRLTGKVSEQYDVMYRVHLSSKGWLGWAKNDEIAGSINYQYRIEAVEIKLVPKTNAVASENSYVKTDTSVIYQVSNKNGWGAYMYDGYIAGTTGQSLSLNALKLSLETDYSGSIEYQGHVSNIGWTSWYQNKKDLGPFNSNKIEAIRIRLTNEVSEKYDIYYRVHSNNFGWLGWAKNGQDAGTEGYGYGMEAMQIVLVPKNGPAPGSTANTYYYMGFYQGSDGYTHYRQRNGRDADDWITINGTKCFFNSLGQLVGQNVRKVIDVSAHQGDIDWDTVKKTDVDGVILRIAAGSAYEDSKLKRNVEALNRLKIPYGAYLYSYAENQNGTVNGLGTAHEAALEAQRIITSIQKYNMRLSLPIYYDLEKWDISSGNHAWTAANYEPIISNFNRVMSSAGYSDWKIYANKAWAEGPLSKWKSRIDWVAQLNHNCTYNGSYSGWQYSFTERINGINTNTDASVWFKPF